MQIKNSTALKERVLDLWKTYLLSVSAQDMLLGEVSDHLYVGDVDFREKAPVSSYVDIGFSDDIGEMAYELAQGGEEMRPYSELSLFMKEEEIGDALYDYLSSHITMHKASDILDNPYYRQVKVSGGPYYPDCE